MSPTFALLQLQTFGKIKKKLKNLTFITPLHGLSDIFLNSLFPSACGKNKTIHSFGCQAVDKQMFHISGHWSLPPRDHSCNINVPN